MFFGGLANAWANFKTLFFNNLQTPPRLITPRVIIMECRVHTVHKYIRIFDIEMPAEVPMIIHLSVRLLSVRLNWRLLNVRHGRLPNVRRRWCQ